MENKEQIAKAAALDRIVNYETYISSMNNAQLIAIVISLENYGEGLLLL